jgi:Cu(I)/Ag(I) efflux system membrane fusion protein
MCATSASGDIAHFLSGLGAYMMRKTLYLIPLVTSVVMGCGLAHLKGKTVLGQKRMPIYYVDPMHPSYRSPEPGIAPDCGMQLVPVYAEDLGDTIERKTQYSLAGVAHVDSTIRQLYGIRLAKAEWSSGHERLRVYGTVFADETAIYRVNLGTDGYVKSTNGDAVGNHVLKNQRLAVIYSPEFLAVAGGYLSANERSPNSNLKDNVAPPQNAASAQARADRLRNLGMSDVQIDEMSNTRKIPEDVYVVSPTDGFIISRDVTPGMRFERHTELYRIADLRHLWIFAEVFGEDVRAFRPGIAVQVISPDTGKTYLAHVSDVQPEFDPVTHAFKPRLELMNPGFHLRPGMSVDLELSAPTREGISIPSDAIVNTGLAKRVFVQIGEGTFVMRDIETGWTVGDRVQVVSGLRQGETVIGSGTFLIDSESSIHMPEDDISSEPHRPLR